MGSIWSRTKEAEAGEYPAIAGRGAPGRRAILLERLQTLAGFPTVLCELVLAFSYTRARLFASWMVTVAKTTERLPPVSVASETLDVLEIHARATPFAIVFAYDAEADSWTLACARGPERALGPHTWFGYGLGIGTRVCVAGATRGRSTLVGVQPHVRIRPDPLIDVADPSVGTAGLAMDLTWDLRHLAQRLDRADPGTVPHPLGGSALDLSGFWSPSAAPGEEGDGWDAGGAETIRVGNWDYVRGAPDKLLGSRAGHPPVSASLGSGTPPNLQNSLAFFDGHLHFMFQPGAGPARRGTVCSFATDKDGAADLSLRRWDVIAPLRLTEQPVRLFALEGDLFALEAGSGVQKRLWRHLARARRWAPRSPLLLPPGPPETVAPGPSRWAHHALGGPSRGDYPSLVRTKPIVLHLATRDETC
jgi:hypothetical protein